MPRTKEAVDESVFYSKHGFPQCIRAFDGTYVLIKQALENAADYINGQRRYTVNIRAVSDYKYCFTDVMIK